MSSILEIGGLSSKVSTAASIKLLQCGSVLVGAGGKFKYLLEGPLATSNKAVLSTVYKAKILPVGKTKPPAKWAIVKTDQPERWPYLQQEMNAYRKPSIANSKHIRSMYDTVNKYQTRKAFKDEQAFNAAAEKEPFCLVLEWMDVPLSILDPEKYKNNPAFMAALFEAGLGGARDIDSAGLVWTDAKPDNVLCSDVDGPSPKIKISDLGVTREPGYNKEGLQPFAMRAPEVFTGWGCFHVADVWSIPATVLAWLRPGVLGVHDNKYWGLLQDEWCMAKMIHMFETDKDKIPAPPSIDQLEKELDKMPDPPSEEDRERQLNRVEARQKAYKAAYDLLDQPDEGDEGSMHVPKKRLDDVLKDLELPPAVEAMLRIPFVLDHKRRPTAQQLLDSTAFQTLSIAAKLGALNVPLENPPEDSLEESGHEPLLA